MLCESVFGCVNVVISNMILVFVSVSSGTIVYLGGLKNSNQNSIINVKEKKRAEYKMKN